MNDAADTNEAFQRCTACGELRPLSDFRLRSRATGRRHTNCRYCHAEYHRGWCARQRGTILDRFTAAIHHRRDRSIAIFSELTMALVRKLGGLERTIGLWKEHFDAAQRQGQHGLVCRQLRSVLEMSFVLSRMQATQVQDDVERLSDEDLQRLFNDQVVAMLVQAGETDEAARAIVAKLPVITA